MDGGGAAGRGWGHCSSELLLKVLQHLDDDDLARCVR